MSESAAHVWDEVFAAHEWGKYPPEELVVFVARTFGKRNDRAAVRLLEIGCGPGANVWYMSREGFSVSGIDGSKIAIDRASQRLAAEGLSADLRVADMAALPFADASFDAVIDVGSVQHNTTENRAKIVDEVHRVLRADGKFFGIMLASGTWGEGAGRRLDDGTWDQMTDGPAAGCGVTHFYTESELPSVFERFSRLSYERREKTLAERTKRLVHWLVSATR